MSAEHRSRHNNPTAEADTIPPAPTGLPGAKDIFGQVELSHHPASQPQNLGKVEAEAPKPDLRPSTVNSLETFVPTGFLGLIHPK